MEPKVQQALNVLATVCANSIGNREHHYQVELALQTVVTALNAVIQAKPREEAHGVDVEKAVEATAESFKEPE